MRYRFTDTWASIIVGLGWVILAGGVLTGIAAVVSIEMGIAKAPPILQFNQRLDAFFLFLGFAVGGLLGGGFFIMLGQMLHAVLDMRQLLIDIRRALRETRRGDDDSRNRARWADLADG